MSANFLHCDRCDIDRVFERIAPMPSQFHYGIEWRCPKCDNHVLDLCPLGPLAPTRETCLNCGKVFPDTSDFATCPECGMTRLGAADIYGLDPAPNFPIDVAEKLFEKGLVRRALATLNQALVNNPNLELAWRIKYAFTSGLGLWQGALTIIEAAMEHVVNPELLISYADLLQKLDRGVEAMEVYREYLATAPKGEFAELARKQMAILSAAERTA